MKRVFIYGDTANETLLNKLVTDSIENIDTRAIGDLRELYRQYKESENGKVLLHSKYSQRTIDVTYKRLVDIGIKKEDIYIVPINTINKYLYSSMIAKEEEIFLPIAEFVQICGLNVHVVDHCNLKCKSCSHSAPLVKGEVFTDLNVYKQDLQRLHEICENICSIVLLGGEPLLNQKLPEFIKVSREIYPYAGIRIITNGVLLSAMSDELIDIIKKYRVKISVSVYPPMKMQVEKYETYLKEHEIPYELCFFDEFEKKLCSKDYFNADIAIENCEECVVLRKGAISRCVMGMYLDYYNKYFDKKLPEDKGIDIYNSRLTGKALMEKLKYPIELCAYCSMGYKLEMKPWEAIRGQAKEEDFVVR